MAGAKKRKLLAGTVDDKLIMKKDSSANGNFFSLSFFHFPPILGIRKEEGAMIRPKAARARRKKFHKSSHYKSGWHFSSSFLPCEPDEPFFVRK
jgi:hypothetical protein